MVKELKKPVKVHPTDVMLSDYLDNLLSDNDKNLIEAHAASCDECLNKLATAYESVRSSGGKVKQKNRKDKIMRKINFYLLFAAISFALSFIVPRYFIQLLVATLLLGIKWITDSKSTRMLVMIHEAWKKDGERGASEIIKRFEAKTFLK